MIFNTHSNLKGKHAFLSPSKYHWTNYSEEKLISLYSRQMAQAHGTRLHAFAQAAIELGIRLPRSRNALHQFVNDAIGHKMQTEQILFYSPIAFGQADAISFRNNLLRIHDLKTGSSRVSMRQLEVYAALFCLEYEYQPNKIDILLAIYQGTELHQYVPDPMDIRMIMDKVIRFDQKISEINILTEA